MPIRHLFSLAILVALGGCGTPPPTMQSPTKFEGPAIKTLSHENLMAVLHDCRQYGSTDDPRVRSTVSYCSAAQSAHAMEGYAVTGPAVVNPTITRLH